MQNYFESPFRGITLDKQATNPNILVGRFSYYSGYYHGHSFDECARYLLPDEGVDRLLIGSFCSIGSGATFIMAGNQGHRHDWISSFPLYWMPDVPAFSSAKNGFQPAGDTVIGNDVWIGSDAVVMPGITIASKSFRIAAISSPWAGGLDGSCAAISPGLVCARTGRS